ncbi:MAG: PadR family transcriptional regulator, partial [Spirochaetaceae bacterium]|nr:PadR family transcriptional regulator [Spirochaetaceae bacterium]MDT8298747.1 PadR family transcriptional regulator [Spirochaetaceae bacterium]
MRKNATRFVILGLLAEGPMTGYDIKKIIDIRFRYFWSESYGQIYPELKKLTKEGLLEHLPGEPDDGARQKKRYKITDEGKGAFAGWMSLPPEVERQRSEFLLKLYWAPWLSQRKISDFVGDFSRRHGKDLDILQRMESEMESIVDDHANHWWILRILRLGQRVNEVYLGWAKELLTEMEEREHD